MTQTEAGGSAAFSDEQLRQDRKRLHELKKLWRLEIRELFEKTVTEAVQIADRLFGDEVKKLPTVRDLALDEEQRMFYEESIRDGEHAFNTLKEQGECDLDDSIEWIADQLGENDDDDGNGEGDDDDDEADDDE